MGRRRDQVRQIVPWCLLVGVNPDVPLVLSVAFQETSRIWQEGPMNKSQTYMVLMDPYLAYPGANRPSTFPIVVGQAPSVENLGCVWSYRRNDVSKL